MYEGQLAIAKEGDHFFDAGDFIKLVYISVRKSGTEYCFDGVNRNLRQYLIEGEFELLEDEHV